MSRQLEEFRPDAVICASHALTPSALRFAPGRVWIDYFDLWSEFGRREAAHRRGAARLSCLAQAAVWRRHETRESRASTISTAASHSDAQRIPGAVWLPTPVDMRVSHLQRPVGRTAGFLANFSYWPNRDAYEHLVNDWLPALRAEGWSVLIAGYDSERLPAVDDIHNIGPVPAVSDFYNQVDVCLAPLRLGGGMKVKVVEALSYGRPVVGTPHATDGLPTSVADLVAVSTGPPWDLARALDQLDYGTNLSQSLLPYTFDSFERTARGLADLLLAEGS
jgi:glycosyltransferase involved in cell wall biosynthesis